MSDEGTMEEGPLHLQGWLLKRGPGFDYAWENRWCLIRARTLHYYADEHSKEKRGSIKITPATIAISFKDKAAPGDGIKYCDRKPFGFVMDVDPHVGCTFVSDAQPVVGRRRLFYFDAKSASDLENWKIAIKKAALEAVFLLYSSPPEPEKYVAEREKELQREMAIKIQKLGHAHQEALQSASDLAEYVRSQGRATDAEDLHQRTFDVRSSVLGTNHPHTLLSMHFLALCFRDQKKFDRAADMHQRVLEKQEKECGLDHPYSVGTACSIAACLQAQHLYSQAESYFERALEAAEQTLGAKHRHTIALLEAMADSLSNQGKHKEAEVYHQQVLDVISELHGDGHPETDRALQEMADCLCKQGRDWDAEPLLNRRSPGAVKLHQGVNRTSFQGQLLKVSTKPEDIVKLLIVADLGQDNDDEMALMLTSELVRNGEVVPLAVIANLRPSDKRAALARGSLDMLGLQDVPVGIGSDGGSTKHTDTFSQYISAGKTGVDYISAPLEAVARVRAAWGTAEEDEVEKQARIFDGQKLMKRTLQNAADRSVTMVLLSAMTDAANLLRAEKKLFVQKIKCVAIMGGVKGEGETFPELLEPNDAHNNMFDFDAAEYLYRRCQELGVQLIILSRFAAYGCPVQRKVYDLMVRCPVPNPVLCRLHRAQRDAIERLWTNVCDGGILPPRCDKKWFCDTFCEGQGADREGSDQMWDLVKTFNMYDPMALLAAIPARRKFFYDPIHHRGLKGVEHLIIGIGKDRNGIKANCQDDLHDYLLTTWIRAAGRPRGHADEKRPTELDCGELTAALDPMVIRTKEEMDKLNNDVLGLLDHEWPRLKNSSLLETWRERDKLMRRIGGPPMLLLDYETVERLGRIPHSAEARGISMEEAAKIADESRLRFFIEMFSHRWSSRFAPDDRWNSKARAIVEWGKYRRSMGFRTFFWVDFTCINQGDIGPGVSMLPLYVSTCNNIICYDTPPYEPRAWCRVERLMFAAFVAPNNEYMSPDFTFDPETAETMPNKELKPKSERKSFVPDPSGEDTQLSYPTDSPLIESLKMLCKTHWGRCWKENLAGIMMKNGYQGIPMLKFGTTEIRLRKF